MSVVLNIISTVNGMENEGMRNIASHTIREIEHMCRVRRSALSNPFQCIKNSVNADAVLIFARASAKTAYLAKVLRCLCPNVYFVLVQKPEPAFSARVRGNSFSYFSILRKDGEELSSMGARVRPLPVGIDRNKFRPAESAEEVSALREKYGMNDELPLILHVGHLSEGRGLEEFLHLPKEKYQRLVIASGMFNSDEVEEKLRADGVRIIKEYLPDVGEVYRMADVYLFPTRSAEFVISIPLSVTETLACGTPVVSFGGVGGLDMIITSREDALVKINRSSELEAAVLQTVRVFSGNREPLLANTGSWREVAECLLHGISEDLGTTK